MTADGLTIGKVIKLVRYCAVTAAAIYLISPLPGIPRETEEAAERRFSQIAELEQRMTELAAEAADLEGERARQFHQTRLMFQRVVSGSRAAVFRGRSVSSLDRELSRRVHEDSLKRLDQLLEEARAATR